MTSLSSDAVETDDATAAAQFILHCKRGDANDAAAYLKRTLFEIDGGARKLDLAVSSTLEYHSIGKDPRTSDAIGGIQPVNLVGDDIDNKHTATSGMPVPEDIHVGGHMNGRGGPNKIDKSESESGAPKEVEAHSHIHSNVPHTVKQTFPSANSLTAVVANERNMRLRMFITLVITALFLSAYYVQSSRVNENGLLYRCIRDVQPEEPRPHSTDAKQSSFENPKQSFFENAVANPKQNSVEGTISGYLEMYHKYKDVCTGLPLLVRDTKDMKVEWKPWSLSPMSFTSGNDECSTVADIQNAVRLGTRHWPVVNDSSPRYNTTSYFVPHGCALPLLSSTKACDVLSSFSHVTFLGDSLTRHQFQATLMILREDLRHGGAPLLTSGSNKHYERCQCDGQFSEHALCRSVNHAAFAITDTHAQRLCFDSPQFDMRFFDTGPPQNTPKATEKIRYICNSGSDPRPRVLILQGGLHLNADPVRTMNELIIPYLNASVTLRDTCKFKLYIVWIGMTSQSAAMDKAYPHQSHARERNDMIETMIEKVLSERPFSNSQRVMILDYVNLTRDAQYSDGVHFLSDVNLFRASSLMTLLSKVIAPST